MPTQTRKEMIEMLADLDRQTQQIKAALQAKVQQDLKILVESFKKELSENQFSLDQALELLGVENKIQPKKGSSSKASKGYKKGAKYKNPAGSQVWIGGSKGRRPEWLQILLDSGVTYESLEINEPNTDQLRSE
jgi:DNA-binding protein H-NS